MRCNALLSALAGSNRCSTGAAPLHGGARTSSPGSCLAATDPRPRPAVQARAVQPRAVQASCTPGPHQHRHRRAAAALLHVPGVASFRAAAAPRSSSYLGRGAAPLHIPSAAGPPSASTSAASSRFLSQGPHPTRELNPIRVRVGTNEEGEPVNAQLQVYVPVGASNCPLVIFSAGFLLDGSLYRSYALALASWGYAAVLYDLTEVRNDRQTVASIRTVMDTCTADPQVRACIDPNTVVLVGHSRGAKLSVLAASLDPRVKALVLLDPVNNSTMTPTGPGWPSALPALRQLSPPGSSSSSSSFSSSSGGGGGSSSQGARAGPVPVLIVGASNNADVVPEDANYKRFLEACSGPTWLVDIPAGHLQFLDRQPGLFSMFSGSGPTPDATVRSVSQAAMIAWLDIVAPAAAPAGPGATAAAAAVMRRLEAECAAYRAAAPGTRGLVRGLDALPPARGGAGAVPHGAAAGPGWSAAYSSSSHSAPGSTSASTSTSTSTSSSSSSSSSSSASASSSSAAARGKAPGPSPGPSPCPKPTPQSYSSLMSLRASVLKAMLQERGVPCADCFDKEALARRYLEAA